MNRLFVYGSLGPGRPNEHVMQNIGGTWEAASLRGELVQEGWGASMGFPGLVISETGKEIQGHVFISENFENHWADLDEFEGDEYQRVLTQVTLFSGDQADAYVYALR
jgi:gamma-glutamylcyclotransferase (GGCT)/AIG2-like uncharacterized protein YtfP